MFPVTFGTVVAERDLPASAIARARRARRVSRASISGGYWRGPQLVRSILCRELRAREKRPAGLARPSWTKLDLVYD